MRKLESTDGFAFLPGSGGQRVTKRSSPEDWMRRLLIALACFWLLVGVILPLLDVVDRATHIELIVKIEERRVQGLQARCDAAIQLAQHDCRAVAALNHPRLDVIGPEVHKCADYVFRPDNVGDNTFIQPILNRDDIPIGRKLRDEGVGCIRRILRFDT